MNRLDKEMCSRKLVESRTKAQELIEHGFVTVNNKVATKATVKVDSDTLISVLKNDLHRYVSRGGLKLEKAIKSFGLDFNNKKIMDIGSSTGGFTDCALKHGAEKIIAIDVGSNLMHESLRNNSQIQLFENTNFQKVEKELFSDIDYIVIDVSFVSILKIIEKIKLQKLKIDIVCLIKPQFECGKTLAKKFKGIVLDREIHKDILHRVINDLNEFGFYIKKLDYSPISGGDGNIEYLSLISNKIKVNTQDIDIENITCKAFENIN